ncbi:MAG: hypothetical protein HUU29_05265, partial [Planctomycetaceae bacterium]|nr:hypothetical protein [Planctomycetaceae bacterium]
MDSASNDFNERAFDVLLARALGGETAPDQSGAILARLKTTSHQQGEGTMQAITLDDYRKPTLPRIGGQWKPWLVAAALLIGIGLLAVKFMPESSGPNNGGYAGANTQPEAKEGEQTSKKQDEYPVSLSRQNGPEFSFAKYYPKADEAPKAGVRQYTLPLKVEDIA